MIRPQLRAALQRVRTRQDPPPEASSRARRDEQYWFPGRGLSGVAMIAGPLLLLAGVLLRIRFHCFFPQQLAAYDRHPALMMAAYTCFSAGNVMMWPAVASLARMIGASRPVLAAWGGSLVIFGLFTRTFHAGINHFAFQLVDIQGLAATTEAIAGYYTVWRDMTWHPFRHLAGAIVAGWVVLAFGAYRSGVLGPVRAIALGLMSIHALGVLKGTQVPVSLIATLGLVVAFLPLGVRTLRDGPRPSNWALFWLAVAPVMVVLGTFFGPKG